MLLGIMFLKVVPRREISNKEIFCGSCTGKLPASPVICGNSRKNYHGHRHTIQGMCIKTQKYISIGNDLEAMESDKKRI